MNNIKKTISNWETLEATYEFEFILKCVARYESNKAYHTTRNAQIKLERAEYKRLKAAEVK